MTPATYSHSYRLYRSPLSAFIEADLTICDALVMGGRKAIVSYPLDLEGLRTAINSSCDSVDEFIHLHASSLRCQDAVGRRVEHRQDPAVARRVQVQISVLLPCVICTAAVVVAF